VVMVFAVMVAAVMVAIFSLCKKYKYSSSGGFLHPDA
jgi:hypothetical protein